MKTLKRKSKEQMERTLTVSMLSAWVLTEMIWDVLLTVSMLSAWMLTEMILDVS